MQEATTTFPEHIETITLTDDIKIIPKNAFENYMSLKSIILPSYLTDILSYAFYGCTSLKEIQMPSMLRKIGKFAFSKCTSLTRVTIPKNVKKLSQCAFSECTSLTHVRIPSSMSISRDCFLKCNSLSSIVISNSENDDSRVPICSNETIRINFMQNFRYKNFSEIQIPQNAMQIN